MTRTPHDPRRVEQLAAQGSPVDAIVAAWTDPGAKPGWHRKAQADVRRAMPVLAAAIDRAIAEQDDVVTVRREDVEAALYMVRQSTGLTFVHVDSPLARLRKAVSR